MTLALAFLVFAIAAGAAALELILRLESRLAHHRPKGGAS